MSEKKGDKATTEPLDQRSFLVLNIDNDITKFIKNVNLIVDIISAVITILNQRFPHQ